MWSTVFFVQNVNENLRPAIEFTEMTELTQFTKLNDLSVD